MSTVQDLWENPLLKQTHVAIRDRLREKLPELRNCRHESYLSLRKYLDSSPERFYCHKTFSSYWLFLQDESARNKGRLISLLNDRVHDLDKAFLFLDRINHEAWHDPLDDPQEYEFMRLCDRDLHPAYLRLVEGVLHSFLYVVAASLRMNRGSNLDGLDIYNCVEEISQTKYSSLGRLYDNVVRNGIAHGEIAYRQNEILYEDKKGNSRTLSTGEVMSIIDDLVDVCNGCTLALRLFYLIHLDTRLNIPRHVTIDELRAATDSPWWHIDGCLESQISAGSQLVVYVRPDTRDFLKVQHSTFLSAALCERFAPGFDRYFFSLRSALALPGWAAFDGIKLKKIREAHPTSYEDYKGVLENNLIFYVPKLKWPQFLCRIETFILSLRLHLAIAHEHVRSRLNPVAVTARDSAIHRNGWRAVLRGSAVLDCPDSVMDESLRKSCGRIVSKVLQVARRGASPFDPVKYLPLGYARIAVFRRDFRRRRLRNYGLGPDLVATVEIKRIQRIRAPDIAGSTIETSGSYRIAWNRSWLESRSTDDSC